MAKFKEGDKVKAKDGKFYTIGVVFGDAEKEPAYECLSPGAASRLFSESELTIANSAPVRSANAVAKDIDGNILKVGDRVMYERSRGAWKTDVIKRIDEDGKVYLSKTMLFGRDASTGLVKNGSSASSQLASANAVVQNAINARRARNAGIWSSAKEAEDRSDIFVRAALSRVNGRFEGIDNEAGTLRDVIKLLASAEQTPKIKKNTDKLKGILSRVEKASALLKGI